MKIWIFNHYAVPLKYYPHARPHYFARILRERGNEVTVFAASTVHNNSRINLIEDKSNYKIEEENGVKYVFLRTSVYEGNGVKRIKNMFQYFVGIMKYTKMFAPPDVIIAMTVHPLACVAGIKLAKKYKCKCIVDVADLWPESFVAFGILKEKNPLLKVLYKGEKWIYSKADAVTFTMEGGAQYIRDKGWDKDIDMSKIFHINNGVDLSQFEKDRENYQIADCDLDNPSSFKVIYTGSMRQANDIGQIVAAAEQLQEYNITFLMYGDGDKRIQLEDYCTKKGLKNIKFKGKVDKKYIPYILSKGNLNLINVRQTGAWFEYGSSENKLFEYLASKKPICSNIKIKYSVVERYKCGYEENVKSAERYAEIIRGFYNMEKEKYDEVSENAGKAAEEYDFEILVDKLEKIIDFVVT